MKKNLLMFLTGVAVSGALGSWVIAQEEKRTNKILTKAKLAHQMLMDFVDCADPEDADRIKAKYEFDAITLGF